LHFESSSLEHAQTLFYYEDLQAGTVVFNSYMHKMNFDLPVMFDIHVVVHMVLIFGDIFRRPLSNRRLYLVVRKLTQPVFKSNQYV
jgi:hypothetical protein